MLEVLNLNENPTARTAISASGTCPVKSITFCGTITAHIVERRMYPVRAAALWSARRMPRRSCDDDREGQGADRRPASAGVCQSGALLYRQLSKASALTRYDARRCKSSGFADAEETARRRDTSSRREYERLLQEGAAGYHHFLLLPLGQPADSEALSRRVLPYLAHVLSPMQAHCQRHQAADIPAPRPFSSARASPKRTRRSGTRACRRGADL